MNEDTNDKVMASIDIMLHPQSIAVIGASPRLQYGGRFLNNLLETRYKGRVYPVNPNYQEVMGVQCYPSVSSLPEAPDLAGIIIPAAKVLDALEECRQKGVKTAVIITGGFAELGTEERRAAQSALRNFGVRANVRLCGPNCLGIANVQDNIWPCSARLSDIRATSLGDLALVSQSGASAFGPFLIRAQDRGIGFSYIISTGNEADLDTSDFIRYCLRRPEVKAIVAYFEAIKDGEKFRSVAEEALLLGKPIVAIKIGRSSAGQRAALSHTASMTGSDQAYDALFKQVGVLRVEDWDELLEIASFLAKTPPFRKETLGIVAHSGGVASLMADKCEPVIALPQPSAATRQGLDNILKGFGSSANPADVTWHAFEEEFVDILNLVLNDEQFGGLALGTSGASAQAERIIRVTQQTDKPLVMLWTGSERDTESLTLLQKSRVAVFYRIENLVKALKASLSYDKTRNKYLAKPRAQPTIVSKQGEIQPLRKGAILGLTEGFDLLSLYGITPAKASLAKDAEEATKLADEIGYPVVLKVDSPDIVHKTDLGMVKVGLDSGAKVRKAVLEMEKTLKTTKPSARIRGFLVQEMVRNGTEVIIGLKNEPRLGTVLLFGLGGVFTELLKDFSLRVCPVTLDDIQEMVREIKGFRLLEGYRGCPRADIGALEDALMKLSRLALDMKGQIAELDINPLIVMPEGQGVRAVDVRIITQ